MTSESRKGYSGLAGLARNNIGEGLLLNGCVLYLLVAGGIESNGIKLALPCITGNWSERRLRFFEQRLVVRLN